MASHEFRTPLSTILSSASLVAKYTESTQQENRERHIHRIKTSVNNLTDLLNEFLSIGKIEDGKIESRFTVFNVKELLETICSEMQSLVRKGQQIAYTHQGSERINLDPSLLRNVLLNLISNAIKFSPDNGIINITSTVTSENTIIAVKDSGIGISEEDQEHLFERFFRGANVTNIQGTGLGLHIVSRYIELMNGLISFTSELEKGTEFIITFKTS
jgi:signal transduction histidine kinase